MAADAVSGGIRYFYSNSVLNVLADNALTNITNISFNNSFGGTGGTLNLNGYNTLVGGINSNGAGIGIIRNGVASNSLLTVDTSQLGVSTFPVSSKIAALAHLV